MRPWRLSFFLTLVLCGAAAFAAPVMSADNPSYSISIQGAGAVVEHVFDVTNTGNQTLKITDISPSCTCTTVTPTKAELAPGKSIGIAVSVDTTGFAGLTERTVTLESNDPVNPELVLIVAVTVAGKAQAKLPDYQRSRIPEALLSPRRCPHTRGVRCGPPLRRRQHTPLGAPKQPFEVDSATPPRRPHHPAVQVGIAKRAGYADTAEGRFYQRSQPRRRHHELD